MNIIVCIKQVPGTAQVEIDEKTGVLKRDGVPAKMNPFDLFAIETAMRLKEQFGGKVSALTMGPPQAEKVLREAFTMASGKGFEPLTAGSEPTVLPLHYPDMQSLRGSNPH